MRATIGPSVLAATLTALAALGCSPGPPSALELLERSVEAHGGARLTAWETLIVKGSVKVRDGAVYNAAYLLYARKPDKLRVEHDSTVDRGRRFEELFLNGDLAWQRRNLLARPGDRAELRRLLDLCDGVAFYARNADTARLVGKGRVGWHPVTGDEEGEAPIAPRFAYLVAVGTGDDVTELAIDRKTYYLLRETRGDTRRIFSDFKSFGGAVWATRVVEVIATERGERVTPYVYRSIAYDEPIEDWLFTEDMPPRPAR